MSYTFTLSQRSSVLSAKIYPPIILNENNNYAIGLVNFVSYNSIPNVDSTNNVFHYDDNKTIILPEGTYEIRDIDNYIRFYIENEVSEEEEEPPIIHISSNRNTLKCEVKSNKQIDFRKPNNIGSLLGFIPTILEPNIRHKSNFPINIFKVNVINIECNLVTNSYNNGEHRHILHVFYPNVLPGTKIVENPLNVIYLPINAKYIDEIILKITDQDGNLINFKEEIVTIRLHLKRIL